MKSPSRIRNRIQGKHLALLLGFLLLPGWILAQVKGNKEIVTRSFPVNQIESIVINFYAEVLIDCSALEGLTMTTDSNLFDLIEKEMSGTELKLNQKEWIQPSQKATITIGAPNLTKITTGTHDITKVINIDNEKLEVISPIGSVSLQGQTSNLRLINKLAEIDASQLISENAYIGITSWGSARVYVKNQLDAKLSDDAKLILENKPNNLKGDAESLILNPKKHAQVKDESIKYIDFKIKNNSGNRHNFVVEGPKPDGKKFSYGFPMMPLAIRKERWTAGTNIYKVNSLGLRELLVTIEQEDENQTVKLFKGKD